MSKNPFPSDGFQHYYLHDSKSQPLAVIAIGPGTSDGTVVRGIAVRSTLDRWDRIKGRKLAVGRCRKALAIKKCDDKLISESSATAAFLEGFATEFKVGEDPVWKTAFNVAPTTREAKILECLQKRQAEAAKGKPVPEGSEKA